MKTLNKKDKVICFLGVIFISSLIFSLVLFASKPSHRAINLPKPLLALETKPEPILPTKPLFQNRNVPSSLEQMERPEFQGEVPTPPSIPSMSGIGGINGVLTRGGIVVKGVLPPNVAVISQGGKSIAVKIGERVGNGTLEAVDETGVVIDGKYITME